MPRRGPEQISVQRSRAEAAAAETERALATLQQAQLNLQYTTVVAPVDGVVGSDRFSRAKTFRRASN